MKKALNWIAVLVLLLLLATWGFFYFYKIVRIENSPWPEPTKLIVRTDIPYVYLRYYDLEEGLGVGYEDFYGSKHTTPEIGFEYPLEVEVYGVKGDIGWFFETPLIGHMSVHEPQFNKAEYEKYATTCFVQMNQNELEAVGVVSGNLVWHREGNFPSLPNFEPYEVSVELDYLGDREALVDDTERRLVLPTDYDCYIFDVPQWARWAVLGMGLEETPAGMKLVHVVKNPGSISSE